MIPPLDIERFEQFAWSISQDIPIDDGDFLGPLLVIAYLDDLDGLQKRLIEWLVERGFSHTESLACLNYSKCKSFQYLFSSSIPTAKA